MNKAAAADAWNQSHHRQQRTKPLLAQQTTNKDKANTVNDNDEQSRRLSDWDAND